MRKDLEETTESDWDKKGVKIEIKLAYWWFDVTIGEIELFLTHSSEKNSLKFQSNDVNNTWKLMKKKTKEEIEI